MAESTNETPDWMIDQGIEIDRARGDLAAAIDDIRNGNRKAAAAVQLLGEVYDVEVVETGAADTMRAALAQIDVAIAALRHLAPEPGR